MKKKKRNSYKKKEGVGIFGSWDYGVESGNE